MLRTKENMQYNVRKYDFYISTNVFVIILKTVILKQIHKLVTFTYMNDLNSVLIFNNLPVKKAQIAAW